MDRKRRTTDYLRERLGPDIEELGTEIGARIGASAALLGRFVGRIGRMVDELATDSISVASEAARLREAALERGRSLRGVVRAAPRASRIIGEAALLVAAYRIHEVTRGPGAELLGEAAADSARARLDREGARRLYDLCVDLRGGVLKLGQLASSRIDLLPPVYAEELGRLQDRVPPVPAEAIEAEVEAALGAPIDALFESFDREPLAAASLAQVHGAVLPGGERVALKVLVPGIEDVIETDIAALRAVAPALREVWPRVDLETLLGELARSLRAELDLAGEAESALRFARESAADDGIRVPRVHFERSASRVLCLERIDGARLPDWLEACEARGEPGLADRDRILEVLARSTAAQILERGFVHADPHPGNFLVVETSRGPELAVLDFGAVLEIAPQRRRAWASAVLAGAARDVPRTLEELDELGFTAEGDPRALEAFAERLVSALAPGGALAPGSGDPEARLRTLLELLHESPIVRIPTDAVLLGRVMAALGGLFSRYRPRFDLLSCIVPTLLRAVKVSGS
ncbi:aarF domain-containing kinase [Myxococcaceae bacterium]|nr:aarF domain-containing kinase [Myxococcaceae bacterium]